jgi:hypothetical protein
LSIQEEKGYRKSAAMSPTKRPDKRPRTRLLRADLCIPWFGVICLFFPNAEYDIPPTRIKTIIDPKLLINAVKRKFVVV